jgi:hypothetical protein
VRSQKGVAKKAAVKKAAVKKPVLKKVIAKKPVAKKAVSKRPIAKKATAKKALRTKVAAKKAVATAADKKKLFTKKLVTKKLVPKKAAAVKTLPAPKKNAIATPAAAQASTRAAKTTAAAAVALQPAPGEAMDRITDVLENYAERGVFRGFSKVSREDRKATFRVAWHRDRFYDLLLDLDANTLHMPVMLPEVDREMFEDLDRYVESRHSDELPEHRRTDTNKTQLKAGHHGTDASITATAVDGDLEYAARRLVHTVHEVFLDFLSEGKYYEWQIEVFDLDPDQP